MLTAAMLMLGWGGLKAQEAGVERIIIEIRPQSEAWRNFLEKWESFRQNLLAGRGKAAEADLRAALESKWDGAIGDLPAYSLALLRWGDEYAEFSPWLLELAEKLSPHSMAVQFALAQYHLSFRHLAPAQAVKHYLAGWKWRENDLPFWSWWKARLWLASLLFTRFVGLTLCIIMLFRYGLLFWHDFSDLLPAARLPRPLTALLAILIFLLPLAAGLGWEALLSWGLILFSLYMKRSELVATFLWFLLVLAAPFFVDHYVLLGTRRADPAWPAISRVRDGLPRPGDEELLRQACGMEGGTLADAGACFSLAVLFQREGRLAEADVLYQALIRAERFGSEAANNRAEVIFFQPAVYGATMEELLPKVRESLEEAARGGKRAEILYNLGLTADLENDAMKKQEYFASARELDPDRLAELEEQFYEAAEEGRKFCRLNRFFASLSLPTEALAGHRGGNPIAPAALVDSLRLRWLGVSSRSVFWGVEGVIMVLGVAGLIIRSQTKFSYRCSSCGRPVCDRCEPPGKDPALCSPCYYVFRDTTGAALDLQLKMAKRAEAQHYRDRWSLGGAIVSALVPGSGLLALGFTFSGLVLFLIPALLFTVAVSGLALWPTPYPAGPTGGAGPVFLIVIYVILMVVSFFIYRVRLESWR